MPKLIIGLAGEMASGKGTVAKYLVEHYSCNEHRFSNCLREVLDRLYLEQSRENLQTLSTMLRKTFGEDLLAKIVFHDAQGDDKDIVVIDGARRLEDIVHLRILPHFKLIFIEADMRKCYERIKSRKENSDDETKTFEEFQKEQAQESESQIENLKIIADQVVDNNGSVEELYFQIEEIIKKNM